MSNDPRLYHELAYLWPIFSAPKEYAGEAISWREVLQDKLGLVRTGNGTRLIFQGTQARNMFRNGFGI